MAFSRYPCHTQSGTPPPQISSGAIRLGYNNVIGRWAKGAAPCWCVKRSSFPSIADAEYAAACLREAVRLWRRAAPNIPTFNQTEDREIATFQLTYGSTDDLGLLAEAFFPNQSRRELEVFKEAFSSMNKPFLTNILLHEVGHILGLRHEFAEIIPSVQMGTPDRLSVMNYHGQADQWVITAADASWTNELYSDIQEIRGSRIQFVHPRRLSEDSHCIPC
ncbi:hypothetical protein F4780DRAFT_767184 [Xylariomycetidae sp. FL0641]|nr:hypothetical protein F4780DRAFT_767184 [Xylariomycetidae sp. FL0641]